MTDRRFLDSVHAVETALLHVCENPLCTVEFPESGLKIEPRRYCSTECGTVKALRREVAHLYPDRGHGAGDGSVSQG